uniref:Uncharacterized protein n=1 Tax=Lepeophtheirus salmonis TaxID=72036 RepID=A0A0K2TYJ2_LEPSM
MKSSYTYIKKQNTFIKKTMIVYFQELGVLSSPPPSLSIQSTKKTDFTQPHLGNEIEGLLCVNSLSLSLSILSFHSIPNIVNPYVLLLEPDRYIGEPILGIYQTIQYRHNICR